jgi:predicted Zn finger-like uncharacterized protein
MHVECSSCHARYVIADDKIPVQGARVRCRKCQSVFSVERSAQAPAPSELPLIPPTPQEFTQTPSPFAAPPAAEPSPFTQTPSPFAGPPAAAPSAFTSSSAESNPFGPAPAPEAPNQVPPAEVERFSFGSSAPAVASPPPAYAAPPPAYAAPAPVAAAPGAPAPTAPAPSEQSVSPFSPSAGIPPGLPEAERLKHERARRLARVLASDIAIYNKEKRDRGIQDGNLVAVLGYEIKKSWEVYKERVTPALANATPYFRDALNDMLAEGKKVF